MSDEYFDQLIARAMDELPQDYITNMQNVVIVMQDEPTADQRHQLKMRNDTLLLGLFEGVPRTSQTGNESGILPGKITLFKNHLIAASSGEKGLFEQIKRTIWHEIAHYFGLSHGDMQHRQSS